MRGIVNMFFGANGASRGGAEQPAVQPEPKPQPALHLAGLEPVKQSANQTFTEHPHWILDCVSTGTWPESTRIAVGRQFARVLGELLGSDIPAPDESKGSLKRALEQSKETLKHALTTPQEVLDADRHIYGAIEAIRERDGHIDATAHLVKHMDAAFKDDLLPERLATTAALMKHAVTKMFSQMLDAPADQRTLMSVSGDGDMKTVFGHRGRVEEMSISMLRGYLSSYFKEELTEAQRRYDEKKAILRDGGAIRLDKVFELNLTIKDQGKHAETTFKSTKEDLIASYANALLRYAHEGYPQRVWKRKKPEPEQHNPELEQQKLALEPQKGPEA